MSFKSIGTVLVSILAAVIASYLMTGRLGGHAPQPTASKTESAYERVIRTGTLRCGYSPWPPFFSLDPNTGVLSGLNVDLSGSVMKLLGLKIDYIQTVIGQQVQDLNSGKIDAMCGDGPWIISTIKYIDYTKPYNYIAVYAYGRADETRFHSFDDLNKAGVTFTGMDGDLSTDLVQSNFPNARISTMGSTSDPSQLLLNITTGKADAVIVDPVTVSLFEKNNPGKLKILITHPIAVYGGGFSVKKGETNLLNTLNEAVAASINTGEADRALKKYDPDGTLFLPFSPPYHRP